MRRFLTLLASVTTCASLTLVVPAAPAQAAPTRGDTKDNAVIFVGGLAATGYDCTSYWAFATAHFRLNDWTGELATFGYYDADTRCSFQYAGTGDTSIHTVARELAKVIYDNYTSRGLKVDVVTHSMGGLVIRSALLNVQLGTPGWPPYLYVEDVITLAGPHQGTRAAGFCAEVNLQCQQLYPDSDFLNDLEALGTGRGGRPILPESAMGTDWTVLSSFQDDYVTESSAVGVDANHRLQYNALECVGDEPGLEHTDFYRRRTGLYCVRIDNRDIGWPPYGLENAPLDRAYQAVYDSSGV